MVPVACRSLQLVVDKASRVILVLYKPSTPEVGNALLIAGASDNSEGMQVNSLFNNVVGSSLFSINNNAVSLEKNALQKETGVFLRFDDGLSNHFTSNRTNFMHISIPEFQQSLTLEPLLADQQAENNTS